ncbi:hypothetical protein [Cytobacillus praedii]|uniref:Uncharacterized protein n=1 Tax=Cytobacillus praedii TaxID=1742358 RepID=A0A4R1ATV9_9BACI|nr:hypothetical protein [Cytobacillus praedii]TCJ01049.1 hypothetical protein E0Y62_25870 [Cytobacillus praedii]
MKTVHLQVQDIKGEVIEEGKIELANSDMLVLQAPKEMSTKQLRHIYDLAKATLESPENNVLIVPKDIEIKVLKAK